MNIALGIDANFMVQAETLIKSVCLHNKSVTFYVFNQDVPQEWFNNLKKILHKINCEIINVVLNSDSFEHCVSHLPYISKAAYNRFYIADIVQDKALYLDSDIIINGSLKKLYEMDLQDYLAACIQDIFIEKLNWTHPFDLHLSPYFNSGVMLLNCHKWREENIREKLFDFAIKHSSILPYGDQCVLNYILKDRWLGLPYDYNFQVSYNDFLRRNELEHLAIKFSEEPVVYHFCAVDKPWQKNDIEYRELYWYYYHLEWQEIIQKNQML